MQKNIFYMEEQKEYRMLIANTYPDLVRLKKEADRSAFNTLLLKILPQVKGYVNRRLKAAIQKGHFSKGKYKADDITDQLFIELYDHIDEVDSEDEFLVWLFF